MVWKRLFHKDDLEGADFIVSKFICRSGSQSVIATSAVQVKRNHGKPFYEIDTEQLDLLDRNWESGWFLFIDERGDFPVERFVSTQVVRALVQRAMTERRHTTLPETIRIPADWVIDSRHYEAERFYELFDACKFGAWQLESVHIANALKYVDISRRALVELNITLPGPESLKPPT